jgi:hypothetical protein
MPLAKSIPPMAGLNRRTTLKLFRQLADRIPVGDKKVLIKIELRYFS